MNAAPLSGLYAPSLALVTDLYQLTMAYGYWQQGLQELAVLVANRQIKYRESVADGLAAAPEAFMGLLQGRNFGKQLVKLI